MSPINDINIISNNDAGITGIPYTNNVQVNGADTVYPVNVNGIPFTNTNLIQVTGADNIRVDGNKVQFVQSIESTDASIRPIGVSAIADARVWMTEPPQAIPPTVPVTVPVSYTHLTLPTTPYV